MKPQNVPAQVLAPQTVPKTRDERMAAKAAAQLQRRWAPQPDPARRVAGYERADTLDTLEAFVKQMRQAIKTGDCALIAQLYSDLHDTLQATSRVSGFVTEMQAAVSYARESVEAEDKAEADRIAADAKAKADAIAAENARRAEWARRKALDAEFGA